MVPFKGHIHIVLINWNHIIYITSKNNLSIKPFTNNTQYYNYSNKIFLKIKSLVIGCESCSCSKNFLENRKTL